VDGHTVTAYVSDAYRLVTGESYLFFEKRVRETGAYRSTDHYGTFFVSNETVSSLASTPVIEGELAKGTRKDQFLNAVRAAQCR